MGDGRCVPWRTNSPSSYIRGRLSIPYPGGTLHPPAGAALPLMTSDPVLPPPPRRPAPALGWAVAAFVAAFGLLLASFPARNSDLWQHLADGRRVIRDAAAGVGPTWLYDLASYAVFRVAGGAALAAAKALAVAAAAVVTVRTSRTTGGWLVPT